MKQITNYIQCYHIDNYILEKANFIVKKHVTKETLTSIEHELANAKGDTILLKVNGKYYLDDSYIGKDKYDGDKNDVIAICLGDGTWALTQWVGLTKRMPWASKDSIMYKTKVDNTNDNGLTATNKILEVKDSDKEELWYELLKVRKEYENAYISSKGELKSVYDNKTELEEDLLGLVPNYYWSASQDGNYNDGAFYVSFSNGRINLYNKSNECLSQVLVHFAK